tara:strand:+ start:2483 stop:3331 length:849 start_codon:yes stop_codon:yes gene_type:complete
MSNGSAVGSAVGSETSATESISPYAAPYVTEMLGKGQALAATPYQAYTGPLTAGPSALQSQAFSGLGSLALPAASGAGSFTGAAYSLPTDGTAPELTTSPTSIVQQYMNPYLEAALNPTIRRVQEETAKAQQELQSQYAKAGGYGGGRQAVAEAGLQNRALDRIGDITAQGYQTAYDKASQLFGDERKYGLDALRAQQLGGREQRAIEQQGVAADYAQFKEERDDPFKKVQYMQSLLQGLPIEAVSRDYIEPSGLSQFLSDLGLAGVAGQLFFSKEDGIFRS